MEAKKIKFIKDWSEFKLVCNILVFLGFANFYWQCIQGFNRLIAQFTSILKITGSPNKLASNKNNSNRPVFSKNNGSKPSFEKNDSNNEVDKFGSDDVKHIKTSEKSKSQKLFKSQKLSKSGKSKGKKSKKLLKTGNLPKFDAKKAGLKLLTSGAGKAFNYLRLTFTKALIF